MNFPSLPPIASDPSAAALMGDPALLRSLRDDALHSPHSVLGAHPAVVAEQSGVVVLADKMVRVKRPEELAEAQTQFLKNQANTFADLTARLGERLVQQTNKITKTTVDQVQERSEAA